MVLAVLQTVELSVTLIVKSIPALAAQVMDGVGTLPPTVEPAASLAARLHLPRQIPQHLGLTAAADLPLVVLPVTPRALTEAAARHMDTVESLRIIVVQDARAVAATHLALLTHLKQRPLQPHPPLLRNPF